MIHPSADDRRGASAAPTPISGRPWRAGRLRAQGRRGGRPPVHRRAEDVLPRRQYRRCAQPRHPSGHHDAFAAHAGGAGATGVTRATSGCRSASSISTTSWPISTRRWRRYEEATLKRVPIRLLSLPPQRSWGGVAVIRRRRGHEPHRGAHDPSARCAGTSPRKASIVFTHLDSNALSARVIAGGEGGDPRVSAGRVRWATVLAPETSRAYQPPPHLPIASQWVPSSPPLRGGEDPGQMSSDM